MILEGIVALVEAASALPKLYPVPLPEGSPMPAMTYQEVVLTSTPTFETSGMQKLRVQFDCFGVSKASAAATREALRIFLNGYRGLLTDGTFLQDTQLEGYIGSFENDARQFRCAVEFSFLFCFPDSSF